MRRYLNWINYKVRQKLSFIKKYRPIPPAPQHLHLGCGGRRADGYCNVDITPQDSVDVVDDVSKLSRFPDGYARSIYACHVLEHFSHKQVPEILDRWYRVLMPGGEIRVSPCSARSASTEMFSQSNVTTSQRCDSSARSFASVNGPCSTGATRPAGASAAGSRSKKSSPNG